MKNPLALTCGIFLCFLVISGLFPQILTTQNALEQNSSAILLSPSLTHLAGTDSLGRDQLARLVSAGLVSLIISLAAALMALGIGILWGLLAGLGPAKTEMLLMRIVDILYAIPDLLLYILMGLFLGRNLSGLVIALSSLSWLGIARLTRQESLKYKTMDYVTAAKALGVPSRQIAFKHILPQMREPLIVAMVFKIPALIALESALSFIGLGLAPPQASYGTLAKEGFDAYLVYPHLILFPLLFLFLTTFSFYAIGHALKQKKN